MEQKKILIEKNGKSEEISKDKLDTLENNPDYLVKLNEETTSEKKYTVLQRLHD
jgi:hypothetical protein